MSFVLSRRIIIHSIAATVASALASAQGATPAPADEPGSVPHFGKAVAKGCIPRTRERIKAVMNGDGAARFSDQPRGSNSPCR
jgi:hypothetical protein